MRRKKKCATPSSSAAPDAAWLTELRTRCARAAARWLKGLNIQRPICTLTSVELQALSEAITAEWIVAVSEKMKEAPDTVPAEYSNVLFG